jgi:hypothetical protein
MLRRYGVVLAKPVFEEPPLPSNPVRPCGVPLPCCDERQQVPSLRHAHQQMDMVGHHHARERMPGFTRVVDVRRRAQLAGDLRHAQQIDSADLGGYRDEERRLERHPRGRWVSDGARSVPGVDTSAHVDTICILRTTLGKVAHASPRRGLQALLDEAGISAACLPLREGPSPCVSPLAHRSTCAEPCRGAAPPHLHDRSNRIRGETCATSRRDDVLRNRRLGEAPATLPSQRAGQKGRGSYGKNGNNRLMSASLGRDPYSQISNASA